ncbi:hypothetical protein D3C81_2271010 [compost metagenome]
MTQEEIETLNRQIHGKEKIQSESEHTNIGLYNINQRLKIYYGIEWGLQISSKKDYWTKIQIKFPLREEEG